MAIKKNKNIAQRSRKILTKRQKAHQRVVHIRKALEKKKKEKRQLKKNKLSHKRKQLKNAQEELIELIEPKIDNDNNAGEINILDLLGFGDGGIANKKWEQALQNKLKQADSKSLDNPEVRRVYGEIGKIFSTYRSGKVPKAFKVIPNLQKWRQVIHMTRPLEWTPQAMYQAVNIFASNFDPVRAEEFYIQFLVPAIKNDLKKSKKLNYHYYESLKKALYKTNAWFKGILFQFCSEQTLLKETKVIESILSKMSIPVISASVAMIKMMSMEPSSPILHYLMALLNKNYSLPKKVVTLLTEYMLKFKDITTQMPVIWHQLLLTLAKQYGFSIDQMAKPQLVDLIKDKHHKLISSEILKYIS